MQSSPTDLAWGTYYAGLLIVSMALYAWTYLRPLTPAMTGIAVVGSYAAEAVFVQGMLERGQWPLLVQNSFFLAGANLVGMMSLILRERFSRQAFLLKNALAHDLKLEEEAKRQSQHRSEHDPLTGLPNRVRFLRRLEELLAARQGAAAVAVLFLDLDGFKPVNDRYGHAAGDHMLAVIAERIRGAIRASDLAARLGGDEFVVAVPLADASGDMVVRRMSAALRAAIAEPVDYQGQRLRVTASIGAALCPHDAASAGELLHQADQDMYASKRAASASSWCPERLSQARWPGTCSERASRWPASQPPTRPPIWAALSVCGYRKPAPILNSRNGPIEARRSCTTVGGTPLCLRPMKANRPPMMPKIAPEAPTLFTG